MFRLIMPRKRTRFYDQIDETQNKFHCEEAKARYESIFKNQQMHPEKGFTLKESNYKDLMARIRQVAETLNWELFSENKPSVDEELVCEFYANLTSSELIEVSVRRITVPITSNAINEFFELLDFKNNDYSFLMSNIKPENLQEILKELTVSESENPEEEEEDPTEIELMQSAEVPNKVEPLELEVEPDDETSMFRAQPLSPDLRDVLSKLMDIMQHMQWQQQTYWRY
ncbi:hypothetical protein PVK06_047144 [Gossypium arboreum]|uniref:Uncharacterized protein n=1 Tax=Gossypium arboreum TaxID=29729 RepID=A0ABR0MCY3_GOSAR|nr:hypothetical protein PVK06_047144 [Gossypium arboreum]